MSSILLIEDEPEVRAVCRRLLERAGYTTLEAADGAAGVQAAIERQPDLILLDFWLPDSDGLTVLRQLKADRRSAHIPVILLTSMALVDPQRLLGAGCVDYILKPFEVRLFLAGVQAWLV